MEPYPHGRAEHPDRDAHLTGAALGVRRAHHGQRGAGTRSPPLQIIPAQPNSHPNPKPSLNPNRQPNPKPSLNPNCQPNPKAYSQP